MPSSVSRLASGRASCCKLPGDTLLPASAACRAIPERGALHRELCIPVRSGSISTPTGRPYRGRRAEWLYPFAKGCHRCAQIKACLIAALRQSIQEQVSRGDFCRCRAGIGRIKDTACFCHIALPCKLYQFCISKFFIEFFLRAATQPQSGNIHGNAQVLHRPPKKRTEYAVPQWNCFIQRGIGPVKLMLQCFGGSISVLLTYLILFSP